MTASPQGRGRVGQTDPAPDHDDIWLQSRWRSNLRKKLLAWFDTHARTMPWRSDPTPYNVWVSEIMLQQTQVSTVLPYYARWMQAFPTIADLAAADETELMRMWEGLGYYRRVRSMHAAAKQIMTDHGGTFPLDFDAVLALPGVGRYTAGAVLSISTDAKRPVLEGNTQRVYSRWIALRQSPNDKAANRLLWEVAEKMLPRTGSGQFNQAAMELGALVCQPRNPRCDECPVSNHCRAHQLGLQQEIPGKMKQIRYEDRIEFAFIITRQRGALTQYLARPLPENGRWAGLWDFPRCTDGSVESVEAASGWLAEQLGTAVTPGPRLKTLRHAVTKYRISLHVHQAQIDGQIDAEFDPGADADHPGAVAKSSVAKTDSPGAAARSAAEPLWQWVTPEQLGALPMSVSGRKIADFLARNDQSLLPFS